MAAACMVRGFDGSFLRSQTLRSDVCHTSWNCARLLRIQTDRQTDGRTVEIGMMWHWRKRGKELGRWVGGGIRRHERSRADAPRRGITLRQSVSQLVETVYLSVSNGYTAQAAARGLHCSQYSFEFR